MSKRYLSVLCAVFALFFGAVLTLAQEQPAAEKMEMLLKFQKGQKLEYVEKITNNFRSTNQNWPDGETKTSREYGYGIVQEVTGIDEKGIATIQMKYSYIKQKREGWGSTISDEFDSTDKEQLEEAKKDDNLKIYPALLEKPFTMKVDKTGTILEVKDVTEVVQEVFKDNQMAQKGWLEMFSDEVMKKRFQNYYLLPKEKVRKGDSWTAAGEWPFVPGAMKFEYKFTFEGMESLGERQCAKIKVELTKVSYEGVLKMSISMHGSGTYYFDTANGIFVKEELKMSYTAELSFPGVPNSPPTTTVGETTYTMALKEITKEERKEEEESEKAAIASKQVSKERLCRISSYGIDAISKDGCHIAFSTTNDGKQVVVIDGQAGGEVHCDGIGKAAFSADGKRLAYTAWKGGEKCFVVIDGQAGPEYDGIGIVWDELVFSPDSKRLAYGAKKGEKWVVVIDGQESPVYDNIDTDWGMPLFSPDSKRVGYVAKKSRKQFVVIDGQAGPEYDEIMEGTPIFSPDSKRVAYEARKGSSDHFVVIDGQAGPDYDDIGFLSLVFSPDSKRVGYVAQKGKKWLVVIDGQAGPEYDGIMEGRPILSPDSNRIGYAAQKGEKSFVVIDGQAGPEYDGIGEGLLVFSPDSKRVAYVAKKGEKSFVVIDGQAGQEYDGIYKLAFSPDGKHVAYLAVKDKKCLVVIDGQEGPEYEVIVKGGPTFRADGTLEYLAIKSSSLYRVKHKP
jgi:Tol biopolymer transport system component